MSLARLLFALIIVLLLPVICAASSGPGHSQGRQHGFALPTRTADGYADPDLGEYLDQIQAVGGEWVQLVPTYYQSNPESSEIRATDRTPTDDALEQAIANVHRKGLKVFLKPAVEVIDDPGSQAKIRPDDLTKWFDQYGEFIQRYASIASAWGVEQLSIGTELAGVSDHSDTWREIIGTVRAVYSGTLVYAANFTEYSHVTFWDSLDLIGVDAYWPLTEEATSDSELLQRAWEPITASLAEFSSRQHRSILFTEAGYTSSRGTSSKPYAWSLSSTPDQAEQAAAYYALLANFRDQPWWAGVYWWVWNVVPDHGDDHSLDYTIYGKDSEVVVRRFWRDGDGG